MGYMRKLIESKPESAYWFGFLMADGNFSGRRMKIALAEKDAGHLKRFVEFLGHDRMPRINNGVVQWSIQEDDVKTISEVFGISAIKTYEPPKITPYHDKDLARCFLVGFIDGDGCIGLQHGRKTATLRIKNHISWADFLEKLSIKTGIGHLEFPQQGKYVSLSEYRHLFICDLKRFARDMQLPVLDRKWDRIDESIAIRGGLKFEIMHAIENGLSAKEIIDSTGCSAGYASTLKKKYIENGERFI